MMRKASVAFAVSILIVGFVAADCDDDPANVLAGINCAFDLGITGWTQLDGQLYYEPTKGFPTPGSARAYATAMPEWFAMVNDTCFPVAASVAFWFGAWIKREPFGDPTSRCMVRFQVYDNSACSGSTISMPSTSWVYSETTRWTRVDGDFFSDLVPRWANLYALCWADNSDFAMLIDDFFLVPDPRIFEDGFESGDCFDWSVCPMSGPV
jgi:hypothetical protein